MGIIIDCTGTYTIRPDGEMAPKYPERVAAELDQKKFEERFPRTIEMIAMLRDHFGIPHPEGRVVCTKSLSFFQWIQNRWRVFSIKQLCPPRCIDRCRGLCKNPWIQGESLPSGFCTCKSCCPCCGVGHDIIL